MQGHGALVEALHGAFYALHGVGEFSDAAELSLRLFALHFVFKGCNTLFRQYYVNRKDAKYAAGLTVVGNAALPLLAYVLSLVAPPAFIWLSYLITEALVLALNLWRYRWWTEQDRQESEELLGVLSLLVSPADAVGASCEIRQFADEKGVSPRVAHRVGLCMEEMVAYAVAGNGSGDVSMQANVRFTGDGATFTLLDDGICIALVEGDGHRELVTDNNFLVRCIVKDVSYQRILDMNYTVMRF